MSFISLL